MLLPDEILKMILLGIQITDVIKSPRDLIFYPFLFATNNLFINRESRVMNFLEDIFMYYLDTQSDNLSMVTSTLSLDW